MGIQSILFIFISLIAFYLAFRKYNLIIKALQLGKKNEDKESSQARWKNMCLFALGQRKMFNRPLSGFAHLFIYLAFLLTQIELIEILIDGTFGSHRYFADKLDGFYTFIINLIEFLSIMALLATLIFLSRRNLLRLPRFTMVEMKGWPFMDANIILLGEIVLIVSIFMMNGAYQILQIDPSMGNYTKSGVFYLSSLTTEQWFAGVSIQNCILIERFFWWLHYIVILGFILYLPYSKHLHIFLAFPNSYYADLNPRGQMPNIPYIENEVRGMLGIMQKENIPEVESFGAKDVNDLKWTAILQAFSCTECGRCTSVCPANITGKKLSPRKIMMDIRDRAEELVNKNAFTLNTTDNSIEITDGKSLFDRISAEEIYACTSCNACVEACPVLINPLQPILELRRYDILMNSSGPQEWLAMFNNLENNQAVWSMSEPRTKWIES